MSVSVVIGTFGDPSVWDPMAERAKASARAQNLLPDEVIHVHRSTLAQARNRGAELATSEWLIFLDADDTLDPGYVEAMVNAEGDLRRPATLGVVDGVEDDYPVMIPSKPLLQANYIVIGSLCRRDQFLAVGGFEELEALEDWQLWIKLVLNGAIVTEVPEAIYRVTVRSDSRNQGAAVHGRAYTQIRNAFRGYSNPYF